MKTPILALSGQTSGMVNTAVRYAPLVMGPLAAAYSAAPTTPEISMPIAGVFSNLQVRLPVPGASASWTVTLVVDGSDTLLSATQANLETNASDVANTVAVNAGQRVCLKFTPSTGPLPGITTQYADVALLFTSDTHGESVIFGHGLCATSPTSYLSFGQSRTAATPETSFSFVVPTSGELDQLFVDLNGAPGVGKSYAFTVVLNGVDTGITCTIADNDTGEAEVTHSISVAAGDLVSLKEVPTGSPTARTAKFSLRFRPTLPGESIVAMVSTQTFSATGDRYLNLNGGASNGTNELQYQTVAPVDFTLRKLIAKVQTAPGAGKSRAYKLRGDETTLTLTTTLSDAEVTDSDTVHEDPIAAGTRLNWMTDPDGAPADPGVTRLSAVAYIPSAAYSRTVGALTKSGVQLIPTAAAAISSGNGANHWAILGGYLTPSPAGETAHLNAGPYVLTLDNGDVWTITIEANCYDVTTQAEFDAAKAAIGASGAASNRGAFIACDAGQMVNSNITGVSGPDTWYSISFSASPAGIKSRFPDDPATITDEIKARAMHVEFWDLRMPVDAWDRASTVWSTGSKVSINNTAPFSANGWRFLRCHFYGPTQVDPNGDYGGRWGFDATPIVVGVGDGSTTTFCGTLSNVPLIYAGEMPAESPRNPLNTAPGWMGANNPSPCHILAGSITAVAAKNVATRGGLPVPFSGVGGIGVVSGSLDVTTGDWTVTFSTPPAIGVEILAQYNQQGVATTGLGKIGIKFDDGNGHPYGDIEVTDCLFEDVMVAALSKPNSGVFKGNLVRRFWNSAFKIDCPLDNNDADVTIAQNVIYHGIANSADNGNPHPDLTIHTGRQAYTGVATHRFDRNRAFVGGSRYTPIGHSWRDMRNATRPSSPYGWWKVLAQGNLVAGSGWFDAGLGVADGKDCEFTFNTIVGRGVSGDPQTRFTPGSASLDGLQIVTNNVIEDIFELGTFGSLNLVDTSNIKLGKNGIIHSYASVFVGPNFDFTATSATVDDIMDAFTLKPGVISSLNGGQPAGAIGNVTYSSVIPGHVP